MQCKIPLNTPMVNMQTNHQTTMLRLWYTSLDTNSVDINIESVYSSVLNGCSFGPPLTLRVFFSESYWKITSVPFFSHSILWVIQYAAWASVVSSWLNCSVIVCSVFLVFWSKCVIACSSVSNMDRDGALFWQKLYLLDRNKTNFNSVFHSLYLTLMSICMWDVVVLSD